jgi:5-methylcytosine-specific restriction endonuclease McrA
MRPADRGANGSNGSKWIRPETRRRVYARDGWRCVWCECELTSPRKDGPFPDADRCASLDHVLSRDRGGSNRTSNLVTACLTCNSLRADRSAIEFAFDELLDPCSALDRVITAMGSELPR